MAFTGKVILELALVLSINLLMISSDAKDIDLGSSLSAKASKAASSYWRSPSRIFAFGFYPQNNNNTGFDIAIWMLSQPHPTVVWTATRGAAPYSSNATIELTKRGLLVHDHLRNSKLIAVSSDDDDGDNDEEENNYSVSSKITSAAMLDSGNFVLYAKNGDVIWESFGFPTDTILGGQNLTENHELVSNGGSGYRLRMQVDGNLVLYAANSSAIPENSYWLSSTFSNFANLCLKTSGFLYLHSYNNDEVFVLAKGRAGRSIYRATLDTDGIFRLYSHGFSDGVGTEYLSSGSPIWAALRDLCDVKGFCGLNSFCADGEGHGGAECLCYPGFEFVSTSNKNLGCYQTFTEESCIFDDKEGLTMGLRPCYNVSTVENVSWGDHPYSITPGLDKKFCSKSCLDDCNCWAALYNTSTHDCKKYRLPLRYGKRNQNMSAIALFKMVSNITGNHTPQFPTSNPKMVLVESKNSTLVQVLSWSLGSVAFLCFVFAVASYFVYRRRVYSYKRLLENANLGLAEDFSLQQFSYDELERATNGFSEELGRGSFGAVYKGITGNKAVAVKRLERVVEEGVREFRAEMTTIGQTHHRNLVQLLGFCVEGSKRLLVYEFMSNGSLSDFLFKAVQRPAWKDRVRFALDVARGLFYLHEECGVHVIHCNLKPQNILLDDNWTARISDFGFARLIMSNQAKLTSGDEESTRYFAPEWQKNALISVKSDIYSFGIVLFEIVCCRRNIDVKVSSPDEIVLSSWVYNCFVSGELFKLVELDDDSTVVDMKGLERMVKVGLWCVQDDPSLRPLMKNVILMLEGTMDIPDPPPPELPLVR